MRLQPLIAAALVAASPLAAGEQIYKWVDARGNVTYSSTPPPGTAAQPVDLPPEPPPGAAEAARAREQSIRDLGDQLSQERRDREAELAEQRKAARDQAAPEPPAQPLDASGIDASSGWWIPARPRFRPGGRPFLPTRPVQPPPGRDPTAPPDHPIYWPREPVLPPDDWSPPSLRPLPRPPAR
jgi:hypothetical protein